MEDKDLSTMPFDDLKVFAKRNNDKDALYEMAKRYLTGDNCPRKNSSLAKSYIIKASMAGNVDAINDYINTYYTEGDETFIEIYEYCTEELELHFDSTIRKKYADAKRILEDKTKEKFKEEEAINAQKAQEEKETAIRKENAQREERTQRIQKDAFVLHELLYLDGPNRQYAFKAISDETNISKERQIEALDYLKGKKNIQVKELNETSFYLTTVNCFESKFDHKNPNLLWIRNHRFAIGLLVSICVSVAQYFLYPLNSYITGIICISILITVMLIIPRGNNLYRAIKKIESFYNFKFDRNIYCIDSSFDQLRIGEASGSTTFAMPRRVFREFTQQYQYKNEQEGRQTCPYIQGSNSCFSINKYGCTITHSWNNY